MKKLIFDLKYFRINRLKLSQDQLAAALDISQDKVSRMEAHPENIPLEMIAKIAMHFGISPTELFTLPKPIIQPLHVNYTFSRCNDIKKNILKYISQNDINDAYKGYVNELKTLTEQIIRKPKIAFVGCSDVGKSTMINSLLGSTKMPAHWAPTTSIAVHIKHIKSRPSYIKDDVWIFHSNPETNESWDDSLLFNEAYCKSLQICGGDFTLLETYGTRDGEYFEKNNATSAVAFIDSDVLLNCDFVDLPGYGTGDRAEDDTISFYEKNRADVIVYLSISSSFMRGEDIVYLKNSMASLPDIKDCGELKLNPLANLFIVASQAHIVESESHHKILLSACKRLESSLDKEFLENIGVDSLSSRFYTYTTNNAQLCDRFNQDLRTVIEAIPYRIEQESKKLLSAWIENKKEALPNTINVLSINKKSLLEYVQRELHTPFQDKKDTIENKITAHKELCAEYITDYYNSTINIDSLVKAMEKENIDREPYSLQGFSSYICDLLQKFTYLMLAGEHDNFIKKDIKCFVQAFEDLSIEKSTSTKFMADEIRVFVDNASSLNRAALKFLKSISNVNKSQNNSLAGFNIKVNEAGSMIFPKVALASLGVLSGGLAFVTITLSLMALSLPPAVGWRKTFAKKLVERFNNSNALECLLEQNNAFWNTVYESFTMSADNLKHKLDQQIDVLRNNTDSDSEVISISLEGIKKENSVDKFREFLKNVPL